MTYAKAILDDLRRRGVVVTIDGVFQLFCGSVSTELPGDEQDAAKNTSNRRAWPSSAHRVAIYGRFGRSTSHCHRSLLQGRG